MIWGVTCFFNPAGYNQPLDNFHLFSERIRKQGLNLLVMELALDGEEYRIDQKYCDILLRERSDTVLWHKESLLNIAIANLPPDCDKVCWLDSDILFDNADWVEETAAALDEHAVVQPFSHCIWLPPELLELDISQTHYPAINSEYSRIHSFGFSWKNFGPHALEARILYGQVGFAWAIRREIFDQIGGLYDADIYAGSGDNLMAHAFVGHQTMLRVDGHIYSKAMKKHFTAWAEKAFRAVDANVGYVDGTINHLWHGSSHNRRYLDRLLFLREIEFNPEKHIEKAENGLYELAQAPARLVTSLEEYFSSRSEDNKVEAINPYSFGDGFYEDEGTFRWAGKSAVLKITANTSDLSFQISNNALTDFRRQQTITIQSRNKEAKIISLVDNQPVQVRFGSASQGEEIIFASDFEFCPQRDMGQDDTRNLSFMFMLDQ